MNKEVTVAVLGDLMLDVFEHGSATRLSPEAPVVVLVNPMNEAVLGGAANTAANARSLGASVSLGGGVGNDEAGDKMLALIDASGLRSLVARLEGVPTTTKRRFLAGTHQIMRLDIEAPDQVAKFDRTIARAFDEGAQADSIVLSDYAKGTITKDVAQTVILTALSERRPVVVDSKRRDPRCFAGCTVLAPNHLEAAAMTGTDDPERAAELIQEVTGSAVIVTLGPDGMLVRDTHGSERIPSHAVEVSDVTGAGDTVTAALAVALAEGASVREAARWANQAAAVAVAHAGTYAVPRGKLPRWQKSEAGSRP